MGVCALGNLCRNGAEGCVGRATGSYAGTAGSPIGGQGGRACTGAAQASRQSEVWAGSVGRDRAAGNMQLP